MLDLVYFAYRNSVHASAYETPYHMLHGRDRFMSIDTYLEVGNYDVIFAKDYKIRLVPNLFTEFEFIYIQNLN